MGRARVGRKERIVKTCGRFVDGCVVGLGGLDWSCPGRVFACGGNKGCTSHHLNGTGRGECKRLHSRQAGASPCLQKAS